MQLDNKCKDTDKALDWSLMEISNWSVTDCITYLKRDNSAWPKSGPGFAMAPLVWASWFQSTALLTVGRDGLRISACSLVSAMSPSYSSGTSSSWSGTERWTTTLRKRHPNWLPWIFRCIQKSNRNKQTNKQNTPLRHVSDKEKCTALLKIGSILGKERKFHFI